jgi:hypothetical protein
MAYYPDFPNIVTMFIHMTARMNRSTLKKLHFVVLCGLIIGKSPQIAVKCIVTKCSISNHHDEYGIWRMGAGISRREDDDGTAGSSDSSLLRRQWNPLLGKKG